MKNIKKKYCILLITFLFPLFVNSQESDNLKKSTNLKKHELKFGGVKLLAAEILEFTYEYVPSKDFSYGASILFNLDSKNGFNEDFSITPFGRFYFQESKEYGAYGFFVEGFLKLATGKISNNYLSPDSSKYTSGGYGLSLGRKWVNNSGFTLELLVGGARGFGDGTNSPAGYFRGDINIGYQFN